MGCSTSALNQATLAGQRQKQSKVITDDRSPEPSLGDYTQQLSLPKLSPIQSPNKNFRIRRSSSSERRPELDVAQLPSKLVHLSGLAISCNGKQNDGKLFPLNQKESFKRIQPKVTANFQLQKTFCVTERTLRTLLAKASTICHLRLLGQPRNPLTRPLQSTH